MVTYFQITLEGELKYSDIVTPIFLVVSNRNSQLKFDLDTNGEILSKSEYETLLDSGKNQYADSRIYETFLQLRDQGVDAMLQDYIDELIGEFESEFIINKLIDLGIFEEEQSLRNAS
ncbi:hypothetical protein KMW28_16185 [Flammeovirga yaeyamensis]|uniref:Uncharacterized protein n=1 Tax=Flammeovirga yaeyamensis TaxID=367791 RepID=A0AAX1N132_9BACT|nr:MULTISPECIES: hypothetical protein [Flammeovirga]ANQ47405.1 hypothetical protein MY04_0022 [Flammeovirga sp. MY04]MBB3698451.1 hypothetical protein [Flammeovirga yaeyamensis]NMF34200.1 hypothetical protein [Flammeovirga yaeyamensis]QWG01185.1 hypothetical protein KMW28_16185 [Flammeovirga yaeyamensis]